MNGKKRTFSELRQLILLELLLSGQLTTNQVSLMTGINWRTVEAHLTFLIGKGLVFEVLKSEYVRIFTLTEDGKLLANSLQHDLFSKKVNQKAAAEINEDAKEEVIGL